MNRLSREQIDERIKSLKQQMDEVKGTTTEVYTRIVGYYRSVRNWNKGKREEYNHRQLFDQDNITDSGRPSPSTTALPPGEQNASLVQQLSHKASYYKYFYRDTCPNCPPVREYVASLPFQGKPVNVDEETGRQEVTQYQVLSAPTVIFFDAADNEVFRATNVEKIQNQVQATGL